MVCKIVSDSAVNMRAAKGDTEFVSVPLTIRAGEKEFVDDVSLDVQEMVNYMSNFKGKSGTACPSVDAWLQAFEGAERVLCFTITSGLSGSYNSAKAAKEDFEEKNPGKKVYIVDTLSAGPEMELLIDKAEELLSQGMDFDKVCEMVMQYKEKTGLMFSLESLTNLANNGRVSPVVAKIAGVLGIRVVGRASDKGQLDPMDKSRGEKKALAAIWQRMKELNYAGGRVKIDHCNNPLAAKQMEKIILEKFPAAKIAIGVTYGLCSFYAENGGLLVGFEKA